MDGGQLLESSEDEISLSELASTLRANWRLVTIGPLVAGVLALGVTFAIPPTFTARTVFLPPQQQQSLAASAIASLGALSGIAGNLAGLQTPADQYVALMESTTVAEHIIKRFNLMKVYDEEFLANAVKDLDKNSDISVGKKDGLITVEVDDHDPQRAAAIANQYVAELRSITDTIAIGEAQQRRKFFEERLAESKQQLIAAQVVLQSSGVNGAALKTDPATAGEAYAALRAQLTAAEVRLDTMRRTLAEGAPEVQRERALLESLSRRIKTMAQAEPVEGAPDYVSKYREFKYQEALFEIYARQYELARADESREGAVIQVVDHATPPELKSKPKRALTAIGVTMLAFLILCGFTLVRRPRQ